MKTGWNLAPLLVAAVLVLGACGSGTATTQPASAAASQPAASQPAASQAAGSPSAAASADISGQTIDVLMPPWADLPQALLYDFTAKTGVKVNYTVAEWDAIRDKIAVAGAANSKLADVTEFDWSWTGQYGKAGWFEPLEDKIDTSDLTNNDAFTLVGHLYGACYNNDFRLFQYNKKMFDEAGITSPPAIYDELLGDARTLKSKGIVEYPLLFPLQSGRFHLDDVLPQPPGPRRPAPGRGRQAGLRGSKLGWIQGPRVLHPGTAGRPDRSRDDLNGERRAGRLLACRQGCGHLRAPGDLVNNEDPQQSKVVGQVQPMLVPGLPGPGPSYGQPEAIGIMSNSSTRTPRSRSSNGGSRPRP